MDLVSAARPQPLFGMKSLLACLFSLVFAAACSPSPPERQLAPNFQLTLDKLYLRGIITSFLHNTKLDKKHAIIRVVFFETLTHQYTYLSSTSRKPNYQYFQPEGWLVLDGALLIVCESGKFYKRTPAVQAEIDRQIAALGIQLERNDGVIVEPAGQRVSYCTDTGQIQWDDNFTKVYDEECR